MSDLVRHAERIVAWHRSHGRKVADALRPGLTDAELDRYEERFGRPLPEEVREFYRWHDGVDTEDLPTLNACTLLEPLYYPMRMEDAFSTYDILMDVAALPEFVDFWRPEWLPVITDSGGDYLAVETERCGTPSTRIIEHPHGDMDYVAYSSTTVMLQVAAECFERGALFVNAEGYLDSNDTLVSAIKDELDHGTGYDVYP